MKRSTLGMLSILIALAGMLLVSPGAYALDPPHNAYDISNGYSITCSSCHWDTTSSSTPAWLTAPTTTYTQMDNLCMSCHTAGHFSDTAYADIATHAAVNTSNQYGNWYIECRTCHNPHYQQQATNYPTDPTVSVVTGSVVSISSVFGAAQSSMVVSGPSLTPGDLINLLVIPNTAYPQRMYRIASNTINTITVYGALNPNYIKPLPGSTYSIRFGKFVKDYMATPNSGTKQVKFFNATSMNSFATSTNKATATGVCQVCHTQTKYFNSSLTSTAPIQDGYPTSGHPDTAGGTKDCTGCHTHKDGLSPKGGCTGCHGYPPVDPSTLVVTPNPTGQTTAGAHRTHAVTLSYSCETCHQNAMPATAIPDGKIQMGFKIFGATGGSYVTRTTPLINSYTYAGDGFTTLVAPPTAMTCSNIYCHSTVQGNGGTGAPTYKTANWAGTVRCGDCHDADYTGNGSIMSTGSHTKHVFSTSYAIACGTCHLNAGEGTAAHVNGSIEVNFDTTKAGSGAYSGNPTPGTAYGNCSATYCHGNFVGGSNAAPTWGTGSTGACGTCHGASSANPPVNGVHSAHVGTVPGYAFGCNLCHYSTTTTGTGITNFTNHADHNTDWQLSPADARTNGGLYKGAATGSNANVGTGYGNCSNLYCHSSGNLTGTNGSVFPNVAASFRTPTWSNTVTLNCDGCHGDQAGKAYPTYASGGTNTYTSNSHPKHIESANHTCNICHITTTVSTVIDVATMTVLMNGKHLNKTEDVSFALIGGKTGTYNVSAKTCSATYCHGTGASVAWGGSTDCGSCHKSNNSLPGKHALHYGVTTTATSAGAVNNSIGTTYVFNCGVCHNNTAHATGPVNGVQTANVVFDSAIAGGGTYTPNGSSAGTDSSGWSWTAGTCSMYCHSQGTSATAPYSAPNVTNFNWNTASLDCAGCHGNSPGTVKLLTSGAHSAHINDSTKNKIGRRANGTDAGLLCGDCHNATASSTTNFAISSSANHVNQLVNIKFNNSLNQNSDGPTYGGVSAITTSGAAVAAGGVNKTCSLVYCHSSGNLTATNGTVYPNTAASFRTPTWTNGTGLNCDACHGDQAGNSWPMYVSTGTNTYGSNSHRKHIESANHTCSVCHIGTTVTTLTTAATMTLIPGGLHLNRTEDVVFATVGSKTGIYNVSAKTCSATYCHGTGASVAWGGSTDCGSCHKSNNSLPGKHALHYGVTTTATSAGAVNNSSGTTYVFNCGVCHNNTAHATGPVNGVQTANISFDATFAGGGTYTPNGASAGTDSSGWSWTAGTCSMYCHSAGTTGTAPYSAPNVTNFNWNTASLNCDGCHTGGTTQGPTYPNLSPKANSHAKHVTTTTGVCNKCHNATTTTGNTITDASKHVNKAYDMQPGSGVSFSFTAGNFTSPTSCSSISCHGGTTASVTWGSTGITCASCHLGATEVRNDNYGDGVVAVISNTQWLYSGHGKASGFYDGTSNTAAAFGGANPCLYCHNDVISHGSGTNVYRLRTSSTGTNMNDVCWACHSTGSAGVTPPSMANINASKKVDKFHSGGEHASTRNGGQFCWDCHTGHGDSTGLATGPIAMFRSKPWMQSSSTGTPITMVSTTITFTSLNSMGSATPTNAAYGNVCNMCHVRAQDPLMTHYTTTGTDGHNLGASCTGCHDHSANSVKDGGAFAGAGNCDSCHGYPPKAGDGKPYMKVNGSAPTANEGKGGWSSSPTYSGGHNAHVSYLATLNSLTLDAANDTFGDAKTTILCGACHDMSAGNHSTDGNGTRNINFNSQQTYSFGSGAMKYNGVPGTASATNPKTCSNISCHFQDAPRWQDPAITN